MGIPSCYAIFSTVSVFAEAVWTLVHSKLLVTLATTTAKSVGGMEVALSSQAVS